MAILFADDHILRDVDQTAGQVAGVCRTQRCISQAFPSAAGGDKVFENVKALAVVRANGNLDRAARRVGNQAAHTGKLPQLTIGTTGAGIDHHIDRVIVVKVCGQLRGYLLRAVLPHLDDMAGALPI